MFFVIDSTRDKRLSLRNARETSATNELLSLAVPSYESYNVDRTTPEMTTCYDDPGCRLAASAKADKRAIDASKCESYAAVALSEICQHVDAVFSGLTLYRNHETNSDISMESVSLRRRNERIFNPSNACIEDSSSDASEVGYDPPRYTIDLSLPPRKRYQHLAANFKPQIATLPVLFDEVVEDLRASISVERVRWLARLLLRRVYNKEENEELRGIQEITGVETYLLVAFNVLLDLFMGCTSGAVRVGDDDKNTKMLHFRTLDWGMDALRKVIVHLDFVEKPGGDVIASSITYVGYVGVLTGVRKGLSMSLNFRPTHDNSGRFSNFRFYFHHLLVLLGFRPSISSLLRGYLLPAPSSNTSRNNVSALESIKSDLPRITTTAAYLVFSDGDTTLTLEKDHHTAALSLANDFIVATNHDVAEENKAQSLEATHKDSFKTLLDGIVAESIYRRNAAVKLWEKSLRGAKRNSSKKSSRHEQGLTKDSIVGWMDLYPILNEETHFATVMDPKDGKVVWVKRYIEPFEEK